MSSPVNSTEGVIILQIGGGGLVAHDDWLARLK